MISSRWSASAFSQVRRKPPVPGAAAARVGSAPPEPLPSTPSAATPFGVGAVPVFDRQHRQVGYIAGATGALEVDAQLRHCMNAPVQWRAPAEGSADLEPLMLAPCLRRIPLTDGENRVCGIVVLDAGRPAVPPSRLGEPVPRQADGKSQA